MSLPVDSFCIQCYLQRNADLVRPLGSEAETTAFLKKIMQMYIDAPADVSSPWFGPKVADLLHEMYGLEIDRLPVCNTPFWEIIWTFLPCKAM